MATLIRKCAGCTTVYPLLSGTVKLPPRPAQRMPGGTVTLEWKARKWHFTSHIQGAGVSEITP